jgi:hypothetical protein
MSKVNHLLIKPLPNNPTIYSNNSLLRRENLLSSLSLLSSLLPPPSKPIRSISQPGNLSEFIVVNALRQTP